jgi:hypothetical protein
MRDKGNDDYTGSGLQGKTYPLQEGLSGLPRKRDYMMEEVFVGRQPILNKNQSIFGYELLFRTVSSSTANIADDLRATASVMANTLNDIGFKNIVGEKKGLHKCK